MKRDNITAVLLQYARVNKVPTPSRAIVEELLKHPDYPSLLSISDVLETFLVQNRALYIEADNLLEVEGPFIAFTHFEHEEFVIVQKIQNGVVHISNENYKNRRMTFPEFKSGYSGVSLMGEYIGPVSRMAEIRNRLLPLLVWFKLFIALFVAGWVIAVNSSVPFSMPNILIILVKMLGLVVSVVLLMQIIDFKSPIVQKVCQNLAKSNCSNILTSKASKVFSWLSWSEIGFFYFSGTLLALLFAGNSRFAWQLIFALNLLSLPYTVYSIYYQAFIAKRWCVLCCIVQALLWIEFLILLNTYSTQIVVGANPANNNAILCLLLPAVLWWLLKPLFSKAHAYSALKEQIRGLKYNPRIFEKLLQESKKYLLPADRWSIILGSPEPKNVLTVVTNPYCQPCTEVHSVMHEIMAIRPNIQARIVLSPKILSTPVSLHIMALNEQCAKHVVSAALHDWYSNRFGTYEEWAKAYPATIYSSDHYNLEDLNTWIRQTGIKNSPAVMINGYYLPEGYMLSDLKYMLL